MGAYPTEYSYGVETSSKKGRRTTCRLMYVLSSSGWWRFLVHHLMLIVPLGEISHVSAKLRCKARTHLQSGSRSLLATYGSLRRECMRLPCQSYFLCARRSVRTGQNCSVASNVRPPRGSPPRSAHEESLRSDFGYHMITFF
jgi:hypothetical protein